MKLSMWIIKEWLDKYSPVAMIQDGKLSIEKIALFPVEVERPDSTLVIGRITDLFDGATSDEVVLVHRCDVISLRALDLEDVFKEVSDAFCYYNNWEMKLLMEAQKDDPEQRIIDACEGVFGPISINDMEIRIIAMSKNYPKGTVNLLWDDSLENGSLSTEQLKSYHNGWFLQHMSERFHCHVVHESSLANYGYGILISYTDDENNLIGQCIISSEMPPTQAQIDLAHTFELALSFIKNKRKRLNNDEYVQNFLSDLLLNHSPGSRSGDFLISINGWNSEDRFTVAVFGLPESNGIITEYIYKSIKGVFSKSAVTVLDKSVMCCINESLERNISEKIESTVNTFGFICGISYTFTGLHNVFFQGRQARNAFEYGVIQNLNIVSFTECAFSVLINCIEDIKYREACLHPALRILEEYDYSQNTQLRQTLRVFVQNERSHTLTSKQMDIHRNTSIYRLAKIQELLDIDLESPTVREHLLLSYRLRDDYKRI